MGSLFLRGKTWWIKYYRNGKCFRESSESTLKMVAKKMLARKEGEIAQGKIPGILFDRVTFDELAEEFLRDYRINQKKSLPKAKRSVQHLGKIFRGLSVTSITTSKINAFIENRMQSACAECKQTFPYRRTCPYCGSEIVKKGAANATINRELAALKRMLNLGAQQTPPKVDRVPQINMLKENNIREGFFEHDEFLAVRKNLPGHLKPVATLGYRSGWRLDEILSLPWSQVDRHNGCAHLETADTKNSEARTIYFDDELTEVFDTLWLKRKTIRCFCKYVFVNTKGIERMYRFDKAWKTACNRAGVQRLFHDFRRTAVRNMVRAGVPEGVAMKITGHKTRSVFERYNIVNDKDLREAAKRQSVYLSGQ
ncbi:site-specific integrase [archaeon]|jgi:integrase|nr:site-specific integrase [archaeon]MBT7128638.1 site-specific integrase [archaeon]